MANKRAQRTASTHKINKAEQQLGRGKAERQPRQKNDGRERLFLVRIRGICMESSRQSEFRKKGPRQAFVRYTCSAHADKIYKKEHRRVAAHGATTAKKKQKNRLTNTLFSAFAILLLFCSAGLWKISNVLQNSKRNYRPGWRMNVTWERHLTFFPIVQSRFRFCHTENKEKKRENGKWNDLTQYSDNQAKWACKL